ncbi:MAG: ABC transporter permease [Deltaproteobacteria bacterium]|nr:ABC transporter permease [Deltaproteobacteria bacterium]
MYKAARMLGGGLLTIWGVATCVFFAIHLLPGDPVDQILGDDAPPEARAELRTRLNLDRPLVEQYTIYMGDLVTGKLGHSFNRPDRSVGSLLAESFPHTVVLALAAMAVALALSIPLGVIGAVRRGRPEAGLLSVGALLGLAIPNIWLGPVLLAVFSIALKVTPLPGEDPMDPAGLILPAVTLGTALMAILYRLTRSSMEEVLAKPFVRTAAAKGLSPARVLMWHALPNALLPVVSVGGLQLGALLTGTVITEKIFERPGLGSLFLEAYYARDIPTVQGCVLTMAAVYVIVNALTDATYYAINPRLRRSSSPSEAGP